MAKVKLTKNELKKQKDALKMYQRYLPTLTLKKQQIQMEIRGIDQRIAKLEAQKEQLNQSFKQWIGVFGEKGVFTPSILQISAIHTETGNIAGVEIPIFKGADFMVQHYDLLRTPLWLDKAIQKMQQVFLIDLEMLVLKEQQHKLERELRITTQRVNLFEKVKIPETQNNIKKISVYLGDQQIAAVVRGKIAKRTMERTNQ